MTRTWFAVMSIVGGFAVALPAAADILNVPDPFPTIQEAIDAAVDGDEVVVADGTYIGPLNKNLDFQAKAITLRSESGNRLECIIDCENDGRFASFGAGDTAVVERITIQNGNAAGGSGGAVFVFGGSPSFTDCVFKDCDAGTHGGALYVLNASVTINGCAFQGNTASNLGGGVYISGGEATVSGCIFQGNVAGFGGGLYISGTTNTTRVENVVFLNNMAVGGGGFGGQGGGVYVEPDNSPEFVNCLFLDNTAKFGGGAEILGSPTLVNCLFAGNSAIGGGGDPPSGGAVDIFGPRATPTIVNCTFSGNISEALGGAVIVLGDADLQLVNCVLWDDDAPIGPEIRLGYPDFGSGTVTVSYSDVEGGEAGVSNDGGTLNWGDGNIDRDPLFVDPDGPDDNADTYEDNDYRLGTGSQAIDAANNTAVPKGIDTDLDDNPRFIDDPTTKDTGLGDCPIVDMGSYEFQEGTTDCCPWDLDGSGSVGASDLLSLLVSWGPCKGCPADFDGNGNVGATDLLALLVNWGPCP